MGKAGLGRPHTAAQRWIDRPFIFRYEDDFVVDDEEEGEEEDEEGEADWRREMRRLTGYDPSRCVVWLRA